MTLPIPTQASLANAVSRCAGHPAAMEAMRDLYARVDNAVANLPAICLGGGACCRFDLFGHRLFVSTLELAILLESPPPVMALDLRCGYQIGPRCAGRVRRPLGCRLFFCRQPAGDSVYEDFHAEIKSLHQTHCLPYAYVELTRAIHAIADTG